MENRMRPLSLCALWLAMATVVSFAQQNPPPGAGRSGREEGQGGRGAAPQQAAPAVASISQRPTGSSLGTIRVGAADNNIWFGWRVAMPATSIKPLTFSDALAKADILSVASVEASSTQIVSPEIPKKLDYRLQSGERNAIAYRLRELNEQVLAYRVENIGADEATRRKVFEFAKALNAPTIIVGADTTSLADLDKLAEEFSINVAVESRKDPNATLSALEGRSKRMGVAADLGGWMQAGIKPVDGLATVKDKLLIVNVASKCGFTPQYNGLESLYEKLHGRGFEILGFPSNQFGAQEPGNEAEIAQFCELNYGVKFPLFAKIDVNGSDAAPLYQYLKKAKPGLLGSEAIKWNFTKFLVDRKGKVVERYAPNVEPQAIAGDIEKLL